MKPLQITKQITVKNDLSLDIYLSDINKIGLISLERGEEVELGTVLKIGLIQIACSANPSANLEKAVGKVQEASRNGAQIFCLPELFRSQYFCQREDAAFFDLAQAQPR